MKFPKVTISSRQASPSGLTQVSFLGVVRLCGVATMLLFVFIISCACGSFADLYKDDKCSLKDGSQGICKLLKECPTAVELIKSGIQPVQCGFEKTDLIVCCKHSEETTDATSTATKANPFISRTPGDISKQKCKEYAEYAYEKMLSPTLLLNPHFTKRLVCDIPKTRLFVGSTLAARREFPHMALLGFKKDDDDEVSWQCGGSLISENFVLTAAHCTYAPVLSPPKLVRFGFTNKTDLAHMQERTVSEVIDYPEYHYPNKYHDISLVRLSEKVQFNTFVRPACLQTKRHIPYDLAIASGWGVVDSQGGPSNDLLKVVLEFSSVDNCNSTYQPIRVLTKELNDGIVDDLMICAGLSKAVRTTCRGDSGGPLQVYHDETEEIKCMYDIIGVISFGKGCGLGDDSPTVHTRVSNYIKWIEDTVWPN